ncbi:MAG: hypothetical protein JNN23_16715 [Chryseobacterium gambrini]|nr:hypothetical protein [Chryseobacterium gambrini]
MQFGKFKSIEDFLISYKKAENKEFLDLLKKTDRSLQPILLRERKNRNIAEVDAVTIEHQPDDTDGDKHIHLKINVSGIIDASTVVLNDVEKCKNEKLPVFVSVRYGDKMGIEEPINEGLEEGGTLHLRGEWIPADKAYSHGGERMSVLHFTHHPLGFICTSSKCYE